MAACLSFFFFFFNDTATTEIYTLSLHDALPISRGRRRGRLHPRSRPARRGIRRCWGGRATRAHLAQSRSHRIPARGAADRKSTRLNSSHGYISYAVFCLKKKKKNNNQYTLNHKH